MVVYTSIPALSIWCWTCKSLHSIHRWRTLCKREKKNVERKITNWSIHSLAMNTKWLCIIAIKHLKTNKWANESVSQLHTNSRNDICQWIGSVGYYLDAEHIFQPHAKLQESEFGLTQSMRRSTGAHLHFKTLWAQFTAFSIDRTSENLPCKRNGNANAMFHGNFLNILMDK